MRLILIKIFLALSVIVCGQTQQYLHNGFVAATDSGVWYLQDGFSEWVKLESQCYNSSCSISNIDTFVAVSYSKNSYLLVNEYFQFSSQKEYTPVRFFGSKLIEILPRLNDVALTQDFELISKTLISNFKTDSRVIYFRQQTPTYNGFVVYGTTSKIDDYKHGENSDVDNFTSMASDGDSTWCWVGVNNNLYKMTNNYTSDNISKSSVSGLHSRSTDSHKICYNTDNDEFIIVSDSGIVYSYDKTMVTTLDTLETGNGYLYDRVCDIIYNNINNYYYIAIGLSESPSKYDIVMTDDFTTYTHLTLGSNYPPSLSNSYNDFVLAVDSGVNTLIINPSIPSYELLPMLPNNRVVFDLDYINN